MLSLIRETVFGRLLRLATSKRFLRFEEEVDPALCVAFLTGSRKQSRDAHSHESPASGDEEAKQVREKEERPTNQKDVSTADGKSKQVLVDWYGPEDQENPRNWSEAKKFFVTFEICFLTTAIYSGSSIYSPAVPNVAETFGVSNTAAVLGLTLFILGYGLGPMLWSPMTEVPFIGRGPIYIGTLALFVALQGATCTARSYGALMVLRFLTGFVGSPVFATGGATCIDMYKPSKSAYAISIWGISAVCGPAVGPIVGGYVTEYGPINGTFKAPWEWPMYTLLWLSAACLILLFFFLPETSSSNILFRRAQRLRRAQASDQIPGDVELVSQGELDAASMETSEIVNMCLVYPFTLNFTEPMVLFLNLYTALIYGLLYIWFESFPIVFVGIYGFSLGQLGLSFLGLFAGIVVVVPPFFWWLRKYIEPQFDETGRILPEKRLPACCVSAFAIPICLFWFGWSARPDVHWIVPIIGTAWFSLGAFPLFNSILSYLPDAYPNHAPSVFAGNDLFRSSFGAPFPLFAGAMYDQLGVAWASSTLAFISIAFIPIPFVLFKYGPTLRNNYSKIARKDN
ncbi:hypothetical protein M409DRAFT_19596 [Zasmidium cellare ATCC 36951]|uniref:Cercosporin MFS transporter CTB4 n=1 Tax=Zasmidium cellare ATCC 36951 TaxID=1080233 RepID=A0A6A6CUW8_ZASCE|nr:uncharacterized protein M409DRAFT_19596 [Zasmidium cellare ATCC 36951]KAF2169980.1 hypothetical protein M409DRAFT_19596 [Zasmidium cellare ATCC 36951]